MYTHSTVKLNPFPVNPRVTMFDRFRKIILHMLGVRYGSTEAVRIEHDVNRGAKYFFSIAQIDNGYFVLSTNDPHNDPDAGLRIRYCGSLKEIPDAMAVMAAQLRLDV